MKASATEAHVALPARNVSPGDKVSIYRDVGTQSGINRDVAPKTSRIEKRLIGEGTVTRLMGNEYAVVEVLDGVEFREHDYVERK